MRMSGESKDVLELTLLERESSGEYSCGALNSEGETRSSSIVLTVQCKIYCFIIILLFIKCNIIKY